MNAPALFNEILHGFAKPLPSQEEIAKRQREHCENSIRECAKEIRILADELVNHPGDITMEACDGIHELLGKIEAAGLVLHGYPERDPDLESARERADAADRRAAERDHG